MYVSKQKLRYKVHVTQRGVSRSSLKSIKKKNDYFSHKLSFSE